ncbi:MULTISPECIES: hypothetical protein [unclassified Lactococcus]|uniref:hypothetical protein n=1 Tax=unclassified Lactococcus TaxID=2643510 RepID=UPI0011CAFB7D|nr:MULTISPECIES: hypothetical protein [unclassified Lactococcus]MQW23914.1 hypothetical protein [Lactococcus sp. dk101]TXK37140.1 hypothetical protein FVP42_09840 [Lactococcus sp. dk310]TXK47994.1 hypothetical protein FVP43_09565 [Lactococcus sp. dk322]
MNKIDKMRIYFKEHQNVSQKEAANELEKQGISMGTIKTYAMRDVRSGRAQKIYLNNEKNEWTLDYSKFYEDADLQDELEEWKKEIQMKLIEQLVQANEKETDSEKIRMNAKTISQLLKEVR